MANLIESDNWEKGIYQLETTDPVIGGPDGIDNVQAKQLANRTQYLKKQIEAVSDSIPAVPVLSVNNKIGNVEINAEDINALTEQTAKEKFLPANLINNGNYEVCEQTNFKIRPKFNNSDLVTLGDFFGNFKQNDYLILPSGHIIQWLNASTYSSQSATKIKLPVAFPHQCLQVVASHNDPTSDIGIAAVSASASELTINCIRFQSSGSIAINNQTGFRVIAIGY